MIFTEDSILPHTMNEEGQIEIAFECSREDKDIIIAFLADAGFEGFDESDELIKAYINQSCFDESVLNEIARTFSLSFTTQELPAQNWNAIWESNFQPVIIDDFLAVRAHFHKPVQDVEYEILITPKMSFGTGHHATTTMMVQQMRNLDFSGKAVFDFGTGTGILAIFAEKLGAETVLAVDNDSWSIENSKENVEQNRCNRIQVELADNAAGANTFDIILANINRNVILDNLTFLNDRLNKKGYLLISGLLSEDEPVILQNARQYLLVHQNTLQTGQWISLLFSR